jgi:hypothetical protein
MRQVRRVFTTAIFAEVTALAAISAVATVELVTVCVDPAKCATPAAGEDATTAFAATTPESAGMLAAPKLTRCPLVPAKDVLLIFVQVTALLPLVVQSPLNSDCDIVTVPEELSPRYSPLAAEEGTFQR